MEVTVRASADEVRAALLDIFPGARCCVMAHFHGDGSRSANRDVCALLPLLRRLGSQVLAASDGWYGAWQPVRLKEQSVHERKGVWSLACRQPPGAGVNQTVAIASGWAVAMAQIILTIVDQVGIIKPDQTAGRRT